MEFGLLVPIVLIVLVGTIEWGWLLSREVAVIHVARDAAHLAARTPFEEQPKLLAVQRAEQALSELHLMTAHEGVQVEFEDSEVGLMVRVRVTTAHDSFISLVPTPDRLSAETVMLVVGQ